MSLHALLLAARNRLRSELGYAEKDCDLALPNGQPPARMGPVFVSVHEGQIAPDASYSTFEEVYSIDVTVTVRMRGVPFDRLAQMLLYGNDKATGKSLDRRAREIAACLHRDTMDHRIINAANLLDELLPPADGYDKQGFVEPLRYAGMERARLVGPDWFSADVSTDAGKLECGFAKTVKFAGARRVQESGFAN